MRKDEWFAGRSAVYMGFTSVWLAGAVVEVYVSVCVCVRDVVCFARTVPFGILDGSILQMSKNESAESPGKCPPS